MIPLPLSLVSSSVTGLILPAGGMAGRPAFLRLPHGLEGREQLAELPSSWGRGPVFLGEGF